VGSSDERGAAIANDFLLCQIRNMSDPRLARNEDNPQFAMSWDQISSLAASMQWSDLKGEVSKKLDEEKIKLERMRIPIDFEALGFRMLRLAATVSPAGSWEQRIKALEQRAAELLDGRQALLSHLDKCSERMQALLAINTSSAWAEFASIMRQELDKPRWAIEAAQIALDKDSSNEAALTVLIAANGEIGEFRLAHEAYERVALLNPRSGYASRAIAKVEVREGHLDDAMNDAMRAFVSDPNSGTARLIGNIYREAGMNKKAYGWYASAEYIEGPEDETLTQAHVQGLVKLAEAALQRTAETEFLDKA